MKNKHHTQLGVAELKLHDPENRHRKGKIVRTARLGSAAMVALLLAGLGWTVFARWSEGRTLDARIAENAVLYVSVTQPAANGSGERMTLPGTLQGEQEAQIYARTNGYVKKWFKDIGASVRKGEILAILDLPDVSRQEDEALANFQLAKSAYERWKQLRAEDAVSQQELEEKTSAYRQTEAALKRIREQLRFGQVVAPFNGIVTRRNINVGDLVNAGNGGNGQAMFTLAQADKLRLSVYVPQDRATRIKAGESVDILQPDRPNDRIAGRIARTAGAIDQASRTMQVDIEIPNTKRTLLPGAYVEVALNFSSAGNALQLPANTLLFGPTGTQVAIVKDGKVERRNVVLGTDYGRMIAIKSGVSADEQVIVNPPDSIASGQAVAVKPAADNKAASKPGAQ